MYVGHVFMCVRVCMERDWWPVAPAALLDYKLFYMVLGSKLKHGKPSSLLSHPPDVLTCLDLGAPRCKPWLSDECEVVYEAIQEVPRVGETGQGAESVHARSGCFNF